MTENNVVGTVVQFCTGNTQHINVREENSVKISTSGFKGTAVVLY
jgi:hypothetical protein